MVTFNAGNKIICVDRNYAQHARELGNQVPKSPVLFMKPISCVVDMHGDIDIPKNNGEVHHELELYVVIGKMLKEAGIAEVKNAVESVGLALDLTLRDVQKILKEQGLPWEKAKCCLLYTSPSPRDKRQSRMPSSA